MNSPAPEPPRFNWPRLLTYAIALMLLLLSLLRYQGEERPTVIPYSAFKQALQRGDVATIEMRGEAIEGKYRVAQSYTPGQAGATRFSTRIPVTGDTGLLGQLDAQGVEYSAAPASPSPLAQMLLGVLPWILGLLFFIWLSRRLPGGSGSLGAISDFSQRLERQMKGCVPDTRFDDVAGQDNAKRDVAELVAFLKHPEAFQRLGAQVPRGVLLMGPPGTGKTLLARALAGEAGVRFYSISGSEFIEVFVGVGASRVRQLFEIAKKNAPSIVFIDELDSVGRTRGTGLGGGHDEREQTLNQILAEMDGFAGHEAVIVLAATNRPDVLDPALLRPGRFDRHVPLDLPDRKGRVAILGVHIAPVKVDATVDLERIAAGTPGFSGAELKNLVNEAALLAASKGESAVSAAHFDEARDKIIMGAARSLAIGPEEKQRLAIHEAGHTLVAHFLPHCDPLYKVSIVPRGRSLGGTHQLPVEERHTYAEEYLNDRLAVILAGRAAEKAVLGSVSSGADDDIQQATALARSMVSRWGMSAAVGPVDLRSGDNHPFLGREMALPHHYSEHAARVVDEAVRELLLRAESVAADLISEHRPRLEVLVGRLLAEETLYREQIDACLDQDPGRLHYFPGRLRPPVTERDDQQPAPE
jgi:cell division protease FtsH